MRITNRGYWGLLEKRHHVPKTDRLDILCNRVAVGASGDDKGPLGLKIFEGVSKTSG